MKLFFIGDIFGEPGRQAVRERLGEIRRHYGIDFVIANIENAAHGKGVTGKILREMEQAGVQGFTAGNHLWDQKEMIGAIAQLKNFVRPANYLSTSPGRPSQVFEIHTGIRLGVISIEGQRLMGSGVSSPFEAVDRELEQLKGRCDAVLVDFHAEATSEKRAMGWFLDGRVAAVVGTHTHVQTADEEILPKGTAFITDVGMTGPYRSVIGLKIDNALTRFVRQLPAPFEVAEGDPRLCGVILDIDERTGLAKSIERVHERIAHE